MQNKDMEIKVTFSKLYKLMKDPGSSQKKREKEVKGQY